MLVIVSWEVELTDEAIAWYQALPNAEQLRVAAAIDKLEAEGPSLGRPFVDSIKDSRHRNMKELRPLGGNLRLLFCFDPRRSAIVLLGGDKTNDWTGWYDRHIPIADSLYDTYIADLKTEGVLPDD